MVCLDWPYVEWAVYRNNFTSEDQDAPNVFALFVQYSSMASSIRHVLKHRGMAGLFVGVRSSILNVILPFGERLLRVIFVPHSVNLVPLSPSPGGLQV